MNPLTETIALIGWRTAFSRAIRSSKSGDGMAQATPHPKSDPADAGFRATQSLASQHD
jgi:hypothetical protein